MVTNLVPPTLRVTTLFRDKGEVWSDRPPPDLDEAGKNSLAGERSMLVKKSSLKIMDELVNNTFGRHHN